MVSSLSGSVSASSSVGESLVPGSMNPALTPEEKPPRLMREASLAAPGYRPSPWESQLPLPTELADSSSSPLSSVLPLPRGRPPLLGVLWPLLLALPWPGVLLSLGLPPLPCRSCRRLLRLGGRLTLLVKGRGSRGDLPVYPRRPHPLALPLVLVCVLGLLLPLRGPLALRSLPIPSPCPLPWRRGVRALPSLSPCCGPGFALVRCDGMGPEWDTPRLPMSANE